MNTGTVGSRVREARESAGISQGALARTVGVAHNTIWRIEHNYFKPSTPVLNGIAAALSVDPDQLKGEVAA